MSCLFIALAYFLPEAGGPHAIRTRICDYLAEDHPLIEDVRCSDITLWTEDTNLEDYVASMRRSSTWGGAIEIKAFCEIYGREVEVFTPGGSKIATFGPTTRKVESDQTRVRLMYNGSHYEPRWG